MRDLKVSLIKAYYRSAGTLRTAMDSVLEQKDRKLPANAYSMILWHKRKKCLN